MLAPNIPPTAPACRSCGAYGGSSHRGCQPGRQFKLEVTARAARDRRASAIARTYVNLLDRVASNP